MAKIVLCKTCFKEMAANAKSCPSCGAKNKKPFYKRGWFFVLVFLVIVGALGSGNDSSTDDVTIDTGNNKTTNEEVKPAKKEKFELVGEATSETDQFATYIHGIIKNNSGKDCSYVQVTFNLYDADGNQVGTALANVNNLEKDGTWKFKAMGMDVDGQVLSFKLAEITGF